MFRHLLKTTAMALALAAPAEARTLIAVLPPDLPGSKAPLFRAFGTFLMQLQAGDSLIVYGAHGPAQLAMIVAPDDPRSTNAAWKRRKLGEAFAPVARYIADMPETPAAGDIAENLMIPETLEEIGANVVTALPDRHADVLLIGSWLYFDPRDGRWAMTDRFYPSDGHLAVRQTESPFGTAGAERRLAGANLHFCFPNGETAFATNEYEEDVRRVLSLWAARQSAKVATMSFDLATCMQRFADSESAGQPSYAASRDPKVEMLRARAPVAMEMPASTARPGAYFLRDDAPISKTPPTTTTGIAWIGLKWSQNCDIDLYTRATASSPWLFFANTRSKEGLFNKDFRNGTGDQQFEFVEFSKPIDLGQMEIAINLYEGALPAPPEGVVRLWFDGKIYEAPFKLGSGSGNHGLPPMTGPHWLRIDPRKVVGLPSP